MPHTPTTLLLHPLQVEDRFGPLKLLLTLGTTLAVHAAGNLMNTLFDYRNGYDGAGSSDQTLVSGELEPSQAARLLGVAYGVAAACLAPLALLSSAPAWQLVLSSLIGGASAYVYTGGPGLKYKVHPTQARTLTADHCPQPHPSP